MKKRLLFSLMAIFLAGFGLGGVSMADDVAKIGETPYTSLQAAINAAGDNDVVTVLSDITDEHISIASKNLTLNLNGHTINPSTYGDIINISSSTVIITGNGTIINSISGDSLTISAHDNADLTIENGSYFSVSTGNTALIYAYDGATITIKGGSFTGTKAAPGGKDGKVFYAGASHNQDEYQNRYGTMIILGGSFDGRISDSNWGHYIVKGGVFTKNEVVHYDNSVAPCVNMDTTITFEAAGFLAEGYVMNQVSANEYQVVYDPVATIGGSGYSTVTGAINAATAGQTVEILKAGHYTLPNISTAMTIKGNVDGVTFDHEKTNDEDYSISTISANVIFDHISFDLTGMNNQDHKLTNSATITMSGCIFNGYLLTDGTMIFNNCTFNGKDGEYALYIGKGDVTINGGEIIGQNGNIVNVFYYDNPLGTEENNITIEGTRFTNVGSSRKSALNIKEAQRLSATAGHSYTFKYNVIVNNVSTYGDFPTDKKGENKIWMVDHLIGSLDEDGKVATIIEGATGGSISYGSLNGGNIVITLDGAKVYSTPKRDGNGIVNHTVTFDESGVVVADGAKVAKPADPTKSCYTFSGWYNGDVLYDFNSVVTSNLTLTSKWKDYSCGGSSSVGGSSSLGGSNSSDTTNDNVDSTSSEETTNEENGEANLELQNPETQEWYDNKGSQHEVLNNGLTREMNNAFEFAHRAGITTMKSAKDANMNGTLNRVAMAKMLSQYAINVLGKKPDTSKKPNFGDVASNLDKEYNNGVTLAYQLGIMGVGINNFRPYDLVPRSEFVTALSRMLYGLEDGTDKYYSTHMAKLKKEGIITNTDPTLEELRGYVMLMLMRSAK